MNRRAFEQLVERVIASIPADFLREVKNLSFQVEDWADDETLAEVGFDDPMDLLGYYRGWPLTDRTHEYSNLPDVITVYRQAVETYRAETGEPLEKIVRETVIHELAHYFGFSEDEMDAIEKLWAESSSRSDRDQTD